MLVLLCSLGACNGGAPPPAPKAAAKPAGPAAPAADGWVAHTSKEGGFTIQLPGTPKLEDPSVGGIDYHDASVTLPGRDVTVAVTWNALPGADVEVGDTEGMLDAAVKGLTSQAGGTLIGAPKLVNVDHHPGRDFQLTAPVDGKPAKFRVRLFVVHDRLFRIVVRTGEKEDYGAETEKLLASFALTPEFAAAHTEVVKFDWKPYVAPDGSFTAKYPVATPRVTTETVNGFTVTTVVGSADRSYAVFVIGYFDEPAGDLKPEQLFATLRDSAAAATGSKLVGKAESAPLGETPGEKFVLESEGGLMHIEGRTYLHGKRLFFLQAQRPRNSSVEQAEFNTFFDGFVLGPKK